MKEFDMGVAKSRQEQSGGGLSDFDLHSSSLEVDFSRDFSEIPSGEYLAELRDLRLSTGPSGNPYYGATFQIVEPSEYFAREVYTVLSFHPLSVRWTVERLTAIAGRAMPQTKVNLEDSAFLAMFLNRRARILVGVGRDKNGREQADVKAIYEAGQEEQRLQPVPPMAMPKMFAGKTKTTSKEGDNGHE
jgi:hypothetical protein